MRNASLIMPGRISRSSLRRNTVITAALLAAAVTAQAQLYPTKPIRLIVPLAAGGSMDIIARGVAQKLTDRLGQTVVVDNRPGAGGSIGAELTAHAVPDGYTLMMASASYVTHALMYRAPYHPVRDFAPITQVSAQPYVLVVHPAVPAATAGELITYAMSNPGHLNYASSGNGGLIHLTGELFKSMTGVSLVHVPYKGMAAAYSDMLGGQVQLGFPATVSALPHIKSGKLRGLAVTSRVRAKILPDLPPLHEAGVPGFDVTQWYGMLAPAGTPPTIVDRMQREVAALLTQPDVIARMAADGSEPVSSTPRGFATHIKSEFAKWDGVIRQANIRGE
jgi:tripartite-type tricarboxylate transporter receptor subunit TctC